MMKCEICGVELKNGDWICSGLDVPALGFCQRCKDCHCCQAQELGQARWSRIGEAEERRGVG